MAPQPVVTGLSPKEGPPGTRITIRGEFLGTRASDLIGKSSSILLLTHRTRHNEIIFRLVNLGLSICGCDCLLSAEWISPNKIIARTGSAKGKGDIIVSTLYGGVGTSTIQFRAYHESIGPMKVILVSVRNFCHVEIFFNILRIGFDEGIGCLDRRITHAIVGMG